jgi:hypothetical protein
MDHPEDGRLLALLDGELPEDAAARVRRHLSGCGRCRRTRDELERASGALGEALGALDVPPPDRDAGAVRSRAGARDAGADGTALSDGDGAGARAGRALGRGAIWKAAVLVLTVGAAASAAVPGSPVREWIAESTRRVAGAFTGEDRSDSSGPEASLPAGVSIRTEGPAEIAIDDPAAGLRLRVRTSGDTLLAVAGRGARYRAGDDRIDVAGPEGPELRIDLPPSVAVRVTVEGRLLLEQGDDGRLTVLSPASDTTDEGIYVPVDAGRR